VRVLADCILDANRAADALLAYDKAPPDWSNAEAVSDLVGKAAIYGHELKRCDAMASPKTRDDPEFRRLVDGALASLALIPKAAQTRDGDLAHRVLIELRSFDNLLAFRFG
jgi:hypothetical protein